MSVELLYTSAPTGLKQGSRGFCTVLSTSGTPVNLATRLETLSAYRHVFPPQDSQAALNPVVWSHVRVTIAGQPTSILSRVAAHGVDYSGRTNKLAHHLVIQPAEAPAAGPAWLLSQPGLMRTTWDGKCQVPGSGPAIPSGDMSPAICHRWQSLTGDAGWGGVVAEALASPAGKPLWIVFAIEQRDQMLGLLSESIALLPPSQRWQATFSTYCTNLPPEVDCKVRCVLEGTEEARLAAAKGVVVDLTRASPAAPDIVVAMTARTEFAPASSGKIDDHGKTLNAASLTEIAVSFPAHQNTTSGVFETQNELQFRKTSPQHPPAVPVTPPQVPNKNVSSYKWLRERKYTAFAVTAILLTVVISMGSFAAFRLRAPIRSSSGLGPEIGLKPAVVASAEIQRKIPEVPAKERESNARQDQVPSAAASQGSGAVGDAAGPIAPAGDADKDPTASEDSPDSSGGTGSAPSSAKETVAPVSESSPVGDSRSMDNNSVARKGSPPEAIAESKRFSIPVKPVDIELTRNGWLMSFNALIPLEDDFIRIGKFWKLNDIKHLLSTTTSIDPKLKEAIVSFAKSPSQYEAIVADSLAGSDVFMAISDRDKSVVLRFEILGKPDEVASPFHTLKTELATSMKDLATVAVPVDALFNRQKGWAKSKQVMPQELKINKPPHIIKLNHFIDYSKEIGALRERWDDHIAQRQEVGPPSKEKEIVWTHQMQDLQLHSAELKSLDKMLTTASDLISASLVQKQINMGSIQLQVRAGSSDDLKKEIVSEWSLVFELHLDPPTARSDASEAK